jgi:hypothetical protein
VSKPGCPRCGSLEVCSAGPSAGIYPAQFRCLGRCNGWYFNEDTPGADVEACRRADAESKALSKANAEAYRRGEKP